MKDLVKKEETAVALKSRGRGFEEETNREDLIIPRAKLLQALSPEVQEEGSNLKAGQIINSLTKEPLPGSFIPIFKFTNWVRFNPRDSKALGFESTVEPGAIIWRSADPYDPRVIAEGKFGANGERPLATKFLNFFSYFPGVDMPIVLSFSNTSFKAGKQLLSLCQFGGGDMFSRQYGLKSVKESSDKGTYYVLQVAASGKPKDSDYKFAERLWDEFHAKDVKIDEAAGEEPQERPF